MASTTRSRGKCAGSGARTGLARVNGRTFVVSGAALAGGRFVLGRGGLEFLELHLQLVEQLAATLRRGAEPVALHLGDQQLQVRDHRLGAGGAGLELAPRGTLGEQRCLQRVDVVGERIESGVHATIESQSSVVAHAEFSEKWQPAQHYPASSGRQVRCGCLQSIPSSI